MKEFFLAALARVWVYVLHRTCVVVAVRKHRLVYEQGSFTICVGFDVSLCTNQNQYFYLINRIIVKLLLLFVNLSADSLLATI